MARKATKTAKRSKKPSSAPKKKSGSGSRRARTSANVNSSAAGLGDSMQASFRSNFLKKAR